MSIHLVVCSVSEQTEFGRLILVDNFKLSSDNSLLQPSDKSLLQPSDELSLVLLPSEVSLLLLLSKFSWSELPGI